MHLAAAGLLFAAFLAIALALASRADAYVYWANNNVGKPSESTIGRANLDGSGINQSLGTGINFPLSLAVDSSHLYWTTGSTIGRANLDGSGVEQSFINAAGFYQ